MPGGAGVAQANIAQQLFDSSKTCHGLLKAGEKKKTKNLESPSVPPQLLDVGAGFRGKPRDIGSSLLQRHLLTRPPPQPLQLAESSWFGGVAFAWDTE